MTGAVVLKTVPLCQQLVPPVVVPELCSWTGTGSECLVRSRVSGSCKHGTTDVSSCLCEDKLVQSSAEGMLWFLFSASTQVLHQHCLTLSIHFHYQCKCESDLNT